MTKAEEVLEGLRAGRLCTVCKEEPPADWSLDECHACLHTKRMGKTLSSMAPRCGQCMARWDRNRLRQLGKP